MPVEEGVVFVAALRDHLLASAPAGTAAFAGPVTSSLVRAAPAGKSRKRRAAKPAATELDMLVSNVFSDNRVPLRQG